jgi:predicted  nucleic acid-binding Zn-ribbon protein
MKQMKFKKVQSVQDLLSSCQRNGQMFNLQKAMPMMGCYDCDGKSFSKRHNISSK